MVRYATIIPENCDGSSEYCGDNSTIYIVDMVDHRRDMGVSALCLVFSMGKSSILELSRVE